MIKWVTFRLTNIGVLVGVAVAVGVAVGDGVAVGAGVDVGAAADAQADKSRWTRVPSTGVSSFTFS